MDLSVLQGLDTITVTDERVCLGPLVTHSDVVGWEPMTTVGLPLAQACLEVGSPQLRNRATVAGNLVTASPSNDTISALYALNASVTVMAANKNERTMPLKDFITGYRNTVLEPGELVTGISFDALHSSRRGIFVKLGLRHAQAISVVHAAIVIGVSQHASDKHKVGANEIVEDMTVALGSVGPTVVLSETAGEIAQGRRLDDPGLAHDVASAACESVAPIDDLRSTADYRNRMVEVVVRRALQALAAGTEAATWPDRPPRLISNSTPSSPSIPTTEPATSHHTDTTTITDTGCTDTTTITDTGCTETTTITDNTTITATVNGTERRAANAVSTTLLDWLRMELGLTGAKEGCAEGECGACTVHLDGQAVLACLIPAARADGSEITTVEGVASPGDLHPVQQALIDTGGVQCGFCTPGFVMSAVMLAEEIQDPDRRQVEHALSGNLCRCTGYYSIIDALART